MYTIIRSPHWDYKKTDSINQCLSTQIENAWKHNKTCRKQVPPLKFRSKLWKLALKLASELFCKWHVSRQSMSSVSVIRFIDFQFLKWHSTNVKKGTRWGQSYFLFRQSYHSSKTLDKSISRNRLVITITQVPNMGLWSFSQQLTSETLDFHF